MKAIVIEEQGEARGIALRDVPEPEMGPSDLLVEMMAAGVNHADLFYPRKHYKSTSANELPVAGLEGAGTVVGMGPEVTGFRVGDRVMAMAGGTFAERFVVDSRLTLRVPAELNWERAAAVPVSFLTAHDALKTNALAGHGTSLLIQGVSSGVGIAALQIAKLLGAAPVLGTSTSPDKLEAMRALGLDVGIDATRPDVADLVLAATGGLGAKAVIDMLGGDTLDANLRAAAIGGRIVSVGRMAGLGGRIDLDLLARKRLHLIGVSFRTRTVPDQIEVVERAHADLLPALETGALAPIVSKTYPFSEAEQAYEFMRSGRQLGKVVLRR